MSSNWYDIAEQQAVTHLDLVNRGLLRVPDAALSAQLEVVWLSYNLLQRLPSLGHLQQLRKLNADANLLRRLPDDLGQLARLSVLDLSCNRLEVLPEALGRLASLLWLGLEENRITDPSPIAALPKLLRLGISSNPIQSLEPICALRTLNELYAERLAVSHLPRDFGQLQRLVDWRLDKPLQQLVPVALKLGAERPARPLVRARVRYALLTLRWLCKVLNQSLPLHVEKAIVKAYCRG